MQRRPHPRASNRDAACRHFWEPFDRCIRRPNRGRRSNLHKHRARETRDAGRRFRWLRVPAFHPAPDEIWIGVHCANVGPAERGVHDRAITQRRLMVVPVQRRPEAPTAATDDPPIGSPTVWVPIGHQLDVEALQPARGSRSSLRKPRRSAEIARSRRTWIAGASASGAARVAKGLKLRRVSKSLL